MAEPVQPFEIPVVIVGGGAAGLNLSIFLSNAGVQHILFEKHPGTSMLPKAHYINQRTMEIFRQQGIAESIIAEACPPDNMSRVEVRTSLGGSGPFDGKLIGYVDAFGGGPLRDAYSRDSPHMPTNIPLLRSEPIFHRIAEERNPDRIRFSHNVTDFIDQDTSVLVTVEDDLKPVSQYRCRYIVFADAGKLSHDKLGIKMEGLTDLACMASVHFSADLSKYHNGKALITHFMSSSAETSAAYSGGALVPMGPDWGSDSQEWSLHFGFPPNAPVPTDTTFLQSRVQDLLNVPDVSITVIQSSQWIFDRVVADKFSSGRSFIIGDAAHRIPPAGGLGMNTAIEDALNLAFKLSLVLHNRATPSLLTTYSTERRPIAIQNADWGLFCLSNFPTLQAAVGLQPGNAPFNTMRMSQLFSPSFSGTATLHAVQRVLNTQDIEFQARNIELGFQYGDIPPTCQNSMLLLESDLVDPTGKTYIPTTKPGSRLPHAWLTPTPINAIFTNSSITPQNFSTQDLFRLTTSDFLLITDGTDPTWSTAATTISATTRWKLRHASIASPNAGKTHQHDWIDIDGQWTAVKGVGVGGAVLVRGDNFVAWRCMGRLRDGGLVEGVLRGVLERLCGFLV